MRRIALLTLAAVGTAPALAAPGPVARPAPAPAAATLTRPDGSPSFLDEVLPVLTRAGCNAGACHGAQTGKNGFRLSLLGYDPDLDHHSLVRQGEGRRLVLTDPAASLVLRKPSGEVPHAGGIRFRPDSREYRILAAWIAAGAPGPAADEPAIARIEVTPAEALVPIRSTRHLRVTAHYADGASRDVTHLSRFVSNQEHLAAVNNTGRVAMTGTGEAVIRASFRGQVAVARLAVPSPVPVPPGDPWRALGGPHPVDQAVAAKLRRLRLQPSGLCSDTEFARRAYLDLTGQIPSPEQVRAFLAECALERKTDHGDTETRRQNGEGQDRGRSQRSNLRTLQPANRRDNSPLTTHAAEARRRLIDRLLTSPEFVDLWTYRLADLLRNSRQMLGTKGNRRFHDWLREQVAANRPWDQVVRALLTSRGSTWDVGPAGFFATGSDPPELAEVTAQEFLGVRLQCAKCHDHPFDRWTQGDYYALAAFFARVKVKRGGERGDSVVTVQDTGEVQHPRTGANVPARSLDGRAEARQADRREDLAAWVTAPDNAWFSRSMANRVWKHVMGRGLVDPVDDMRASNPPANEALMRALSDHLVRSGFDLRSLVRLIVTSRTYQLGAATNASNRFDDTQFSRHIVRRLTAEQFLDSLVAATGVPEKFTGFPPGTRAAQLPDSGIPSYPLDLFGRPARNSVCECERESEPTLGVALHLANGETINGKIAAPGGRLARLLEAGKPDREIVEELFLATFSRPPSAAELAGALKAVSAAQGAAGTRREAFADLFWALLNAREFLFTH